jgi:hypothetical protein
MAKIKKSKAHSFPPMNGAVANDNGDVPLAYQWWLNVIMGIAPNQTGHLADQRATGQCVGAAVRNGPNIAV